MFTVVVAIMVVEVFLPLALLMLLSLLGSREWNGNGYCCGFWVDDNEWEPIVRRFIRLTEIG